MADPVFSLCRPAANAEGQARIGAPAKSHAQLDRHHRETEAHFSAFVEHLVQQSIAAEQRAASSPILEQLQGISRYYRSGSLNRLIVYTDGLNNSPNGQFCVKRGELPRFAVFAERPGYRFVAPQNFARAEVDVLLVEGEPLPTDALPFCTDDELRTFWVDYFEANGAGAVGLTPLGYGAGQ